MPVTVALTHSTEYEFDQLVEIHPHVVRLRPALHARTPIKSYSLKVTPDDHFVNWQQDPFGNFLARFVFPNKARRLRFEVDLIAEMTVLNPFDFFLEEQAQIFPFEYDEEVQRDLAPYLTCHRTGKRLQEWLSEVSLKPCGTVDFLVDLNQRLEQDVSYLVRMEPGVQTPEQTLKLGSGSCRDSAWLLVQILRRLGLAARFASGYLIQLTADQKPLDGPPGPSQDFTDLHAWAEVYLPGAGWVGLDPTSGLFAGEGHIPLACTPEPRSAAAITGATGPCEVTFNYDNRVSRIHEDPRVTLPINDREWARVNALGRHVDERLQEQDVRLTMGGEPTFVSATNMDGPEWNTEALSEEKLILGHRLFDTLASEFDQSGFRHYGQGKWYPGEPLPRWALSLFWRKDGGKLTHHPGTLTGPDDAQPCDDRDAKRFAKKLCGQLDIDKQFLIPAYEDSTALIREEAELPENLTPGDKRLKDPLQRARLARLLEKGELTRVAAWVLPIEWHVTGEGTGVWQSAEWPLRRTELFLQPGDSPAGLRLPLDSLPWQTEEALEEDQPADPFSEQTLTVRRDLKPAPQDRRGIRRIPHTALCIERRDKVLHLFMPPVAELAPYLDLVTSIEEVAAKQGLQVVLEGYAPPQDVQLQKLSVTPDPGVIEVNVHPSASWEDLSEVTELLYNKTAALQLGTEKFMVDGRHCGTGGGNHVTLGAAEPVDSPFLRRPDLLRSLLIYWQRHPSLSYLFSGLFIGPTSQAPRVDEARDDNLYELEIALSQFPEGDSEKPWLVDRVLRNFLVDLTGNTHRAEFCIDKLYAPNSASGRLGLVELRAFEMPPHARMSMMQMLLIRALVAMFWAKPLATNLVRWGTSLHDRFMLRHFVAEDFNNVINDLRQHGFEFSASWFDPFLEFRFPRLGSLQVGDMHMELHGALEPWHVLGEESGSQGTARFVDSTVERLQVSVTGASREQYLVTCNGRRVPLVPVGADQLVGGVRFKAWEQSSSLHPGIEPHAPLVFDVLDTVNQRSLGGCLYHVSHPGGRSYDTFPVNASEAEARRNARFFRHGHTQGTIDVPHEELNIDHPVTLDLRRPPRLRD
ncbi:MAG: transglutaminase family protein [Pseudomonadota bacterium]